MNPNTNVLDAVNKYVRNICNIFILDDLVVSTYGTNILLKEKLNILFFFFSNSSWMLGARLTKGRNSLTDLVVKLNLWLRAFYKNLRLADYDENRL